MSTVYQDLREAARDVVLQEGRHRLGPAFATVPKAAIDRLEEALRAVDEARTPARIRDLAPDWDSTPYVPGEELDVDDIARRIGADR